jgi:oligoribonuclease NrnB/cAMP/cGMP phosphodiesterase (DHH superfamily)
MFIGDRDTWTWKYGEDTRDFFNGSELYDLHPLNEENWNVLFEHPEIIREEGYSIERYKTQHSQNYLKDYGFEVEFEGHKANCVNIGKVGTEFFDSIEYQHPLLISYAFNGKEYIVSLRSETIDVGALALKYGGGGHHGASGLTCKDLPWKVI